MCARRPTSAMPKSFLCCERAFCRSMVVMFCALKWSVLMSWCLLWGLVMWWSRHLMRCNGLCCVMSRDAMRCHGDELYYSSTTLYYKVLLQYYSVLQSTTPILFRTTNTTLYYSSATLYYKVPLKYYSVLLQYYPVLQSTSWLIRITYETSFTKRGATKGSLQLQQILCLPRKMNLMIDRHRIWNVIHNAQSNRHHPPSSPNTAPATQNESHDWSISHMKRHLQCAEQQSTPSNLTKYCACHAKWMSWLINITYENHLQCGEQEASPSNFTKYCACHAKWISWLIRITYETSFTMRGATGITLQPHQILRLPRKMNLMIDPHHIWNVIYNAQSNRHHPPSSPNTAPATQNESHDWSASHMKRHLQCAEQQASTSNLTKYCACHAKWPPNIWQKFAENRWNVISNARPIREYPRTIRAWSDPENANRNPPRRQGYFSHSPGADSIENYNVSRSGYHSKFHHMLRLPRKVTHELHQMLRLPRTSPKWHMNSTKCCACHEKWHEVTHDYYYYSCYYYYYYYSCCYYYYYYY